MRKQIILLGNQMTDDVADDMSIHIKGSLTKPHQLKAEGIITDTFIPRPMLFNIAHHNYLGPKLNQGRRVLYFGMHIYVIRY